MLQSYLPIVIFAGIALVFIGASFFASTLLAPKRRTMAKTAPYECGIVPENDTQQRFGVKFYLIAIAFIILDVEIIFLYPFATVFVDKVVNGEVIPGLGTAGLGVIGIFLIILLVPFAYLLSSGALNFGPKTPKVQNALSPVTRSQGYVASVSSETVSSPSERSEPEVSSLSANVSEETYATKSNSGGRETESNDPNAISLNESVERDSPEAGEGEK